MRKNRLRSILLSFIGKVEPQRGFDHVHHGDLSTDREQLFQDRKRLEARLIEEEQANRLVENPHFPNISVMPLVAEPAYLLPGVKIMKRDAQDRRYYITPDDGTTPASDFIDALCSTCIHE